MAKLNLTEPATGRHQYVYTDILRSCTRISRDDLDSFLVLAYQVASYAESVLFEVALCLLALRVSCVEDVSFPQPFFLIGLLRDFLCGQRQSR